MSLHVQKRTKSSLLSEKKHELQCTYCDYGLGKLNKQLCYFFRFILRIFLFSEFSNCACCLPLPLFCSHFPPDFTLSPEVRLPKKDRGRRGYRRRRRGGGGGGEAPEDKPRKLRGRFPFPFPFPAPFSFSLGRGRRAGGREGKERETGKKNFQSVTEAGPERGPRTTGARDEASPDSGESFLK